MTLDSSVLKAVVLDRDYRSNEEVKAVLADLRKDVELAWIHGCKEIENFLLNSTVLERAIRARLAERSRRFGEVAKELPDVSKLLHEITSPMKAEVAGQYLAKRSEYLRKRQPGLDLATCNAEVMRTFEKEWEALESRLGMVSGKQVLADLNQRLQRTLGVSISNAQICSHFKRDEVPEDLKVLLKKVKEFSEEAPPR
jgi:hypothetical protein